MHSVYRDADAFIFASTCENMPNILLEAMASGLPIVSSNHGPMPEVLGDAGQYMDPLNVAEIEKAITNLVQDHELRASCAESAFQRAIPFSWENCAQSTFSFVQRVKAAQ
jgi:glycosyltransferase involved in cell wall biosynthesis